MLTEDPAGEFPRPRPDLDPGPEACSGAGKTVIVSGGSRGLGLNWSRVSSSAGSASRRSAGVRSEFIDSVERRQKGFYWSAIDSAEFEALPGFVNEVLDRFGRIDVLVNNAGQGVEGVLPTMRVSEIVEAVDVNLTATLVLCQTCSRVMLRQGAGCVINISSINALRGQGGVRYTARQKPRWTGLRGASRVNSDLAIFASTRSPPDTLKATWSKACRRNAKVGSSGARP